jgi:chaperonin GroEL
MRGTLKVAAVKAPDFGERRTLILEDIATLTGGTVVSHQKGMRLDKFNKDWFGQARTITVGKDVTTIVDGKGETEAIEARITELKNQIDNSQSPYEIEKLQERLSKMIGGVAIINVGGGTEIEMKEKKDRLDDALQATKAALDEGILPGAGVALLHARTAISYAKADGDDFNKGQRIVDIACKSPFTQILTNAGENQYDWLMALSKESDNPNLVPGLSEERLVDAYESGIIDPTKVVRSALENAAHAAVTLLMTECVIHEKPSDKKNDSGMDMMGGMGM